MKFELDFSKLNVGLGTGVMGQYIDVDGHPMLVAVCQLDHPELPISEGQLKSANQAGRPKEKIIPYIVKGSATLKNGSSFNLQIKAPRTNSGKNSTGFSFGS